MWCFQGLEAMGRTGTGAGLVLCLMAGAGPIPRLSCSPKHVLVNPVNARGEAKGFLARQSR